MGVDYRICVYLHGTICERKKVSTRSEADYFLNQLSSKYKLRDLKQMEVKIHSIFKVNVSK